MIVDESAHPPSDRLAAYVLGKLHGEESEAIEHHVAGCSTCCTVLAGTPDDWFVDLLRPSEQTGSWVAPPSALADLPPQLARHTRYRVLKQVGKGGMGTVYRARDTTLHRQVAIKVIRPDLLQNQAALERFKREMQLVAGLNHPNIVTVHDAEVGESAFLVMEWLEGETLAERVKKGGPMPIPRACDCIIQAAAGLEYAAEVGLVHRDIKPHNLMLTRSGVVKVLDFGLARAVKQTEPNAELTPSGVIVGTPAYMAPELILDPAHVDRRADVYSLGCTLYQLLGGHPPFVGETAIDVLNAHLRQPAPSIRDVRKDAPDALARVLEKALAKDRANRFKSAGELIEALAPFTRPIPAAPVRPPRRKLAAALGAVLAAAAVLLGAWFFWPDNDVSHVNLDQKKQEPNAPGGKEQEGEAPGVKDPSPNPQVEDEGPGEIKIFRGHGNHVHSLDVGRRNPIFVSGSFGELWLWHLDEGLPRKKFRGFQGWVYSLALSPDDRTCLAGIQAGRLLVFDVEKEEPTPVPKPLGGMFTSMAISPDGQHYFWLTERAGEFGRFRPDGTPEPLRGITGGAGCFSPSGDRLLTANEQQLIVMDTKTQKDVNTIDFSLPIGSLAFDGERILVGHVGSTGGLLMLVNLRTGDTPVLNGHTRTVRSVAFSPDGRRAASGSMDGTIRIWDTATGNEIHVFDRHKGGVNVVKFLADGKRLLSAGDDKSIRLWRLPAQ
jgi:serine/threonine protein kinase